MENKECYAVIESIYKQINSICDKLYDIVWEPQDLAGKNHFNTLPKEERAALIGLLNDADRFRNSFTMYIVGLKINNYVLDR